MDVSRLMAPVYRTNVDRNIGQLNRDVYTYTIGDVLKKPTIKVSRINGYLFMKRIMRVEEAIKGFVTIVA